jgi:integrase/recombinase XerD
MDLASRVRFSGPLKPYAAGFEAELARLGYTPLSATVQLRLAAELSRHLESAGLAVLTGEAAAEFLAGRKARGCREYVHMRALGPLLGYLRGIGAAPPPEAVGPQGPAGLLLDSWDRYLEGERGLGAQTRAYYVSNARPFAEACLAREGMPGGLTAGDVIAFMVRTARERTPDGTRHAAASLRSLLRFMHVRGLIAGPLADAVPAVSRRGRTGRRTPATAQAVAGMLAGCDRSGPAGLRDYAIIVLLARLGLRAGEVAGLTLDDLDWHAGLITVHGKGGSADRMPLPPGAGAAIAAWLRDGRPRDALDRSVFTRLAAPRRGLTAGALKYVVTSAAAKAGAGPASPHRLRHTAATETLAAGAPLDEVRQVLRHRREATTAIYASVGTGRLRPLARPWPGCAS